MRGHLRQISEFGIHEKVARVFSKYEAGSVLHRVATLATNSIQKYIFRTFQTKEKGKVSS